MDFIAVASATEWPRSAWDRPEESEVTGSLLQPDHLHGQQVALIAHKMFGSSSSPLVTDDADGTIGITITGTGRDGTGGEGHIAHWEIPGTNGALADEPGAWPMFHHDPQLTGTTISPIQS